MRRKIIKAVNEAPKTIKIPQNIKNNVNKKFDVMSKEKYKHIPLKDIFNTLKLSSILPVAEDGTEWEGMLSGHEGRQRIDLHYLDMKSGNYLPVNNAMLVITWYRLQSGKFEIVVYVS